DVYFKTKYPEHNLVRTRTQFALVKAIEDNYDKLLEITLRG
ncbi:MAG: aminoglycoside phosphotransferase family protein, partial [Clostridia bacterium]|nr:aminoglycoside phosphotransferase family protein [Clostridia bacterium]